MRESDAAFWGLVRGVEKRLMWLIGGVAGALFLVNMAAMLPVQIAERFQQRATGVVIELANGEGSFKVELKSPDNQLLWSQSVQLLVQPS